MKKNKSLLLLLTLVLTVGTLLSACGSNAKDNTPSNSGNTGNTATSNNDTATSGEEKLAADQTLRINLSSEPPTFDPAQAQDSQANTVLKLMYEGLTRMDEHGEAQPAAAESWDIEGTKYTFKLRQGATWTMVIL